MVVRAPDPEPRFERIADGVVAQVIEPSFRLPPRLDAMLARTIVTAEFPMRVVGARIACRDAEHDFGRPWIRGVFAGLEVKLSRCPYCGTVEVRDVSVDVLEGMGPSTLDPRRRDVVIGWYTGRRAGGRQYL